MVLLVILFSKEQVDALRHHGWNSGDFVSTSDDFERYVVRSSRASSGGSRRANSRKIAETAAVADSANGATVNQPLTTCTSNMTMCGTFCVETDRDVNNCGACFNFCPVGQFCCGGKCTTMQADTDNCGSCGARCPGECALGICNYGGTAASGSNARLP